MKTRTNAAQTPPLRQRTLSMSSDELRAIVATARPQDKYGYEYKMALEELIARQVGRVVRNRQDGFNEIVHGII